MSCVYSFSCIKIEARGRSFTTTKRYLKPLLYMHCPQHMLASAYPYSPAKATNPALKELMTCLSSWGGFRQSKRQDLLMTVDVTSYITVRSGKSERSATPLSPVPRLRLRVLAEESRS